MSDHTAQVLTLFFVSVTIAANLANLVLSVRRRRQAKRHREMMRR